ncbi:CPBP family intramembrane glutamic endopeptidase [Tychonema sp. LEGE 06208]|uniref:CPBP family intramembrane glutamic endopeptidase n=1 Tax=Tychonema sp. LEGE 06208 TaxID=1828663 RepID=UPI001881A639|nr:CPBP family intramembrane glutamic endopeptidase [Tychonema sp. LEGE 06208]MBE9164890.1 CPBP family intramembrane metalloprotease [Tychonema sp. LEGE 06208]
MTTNTSNKHHLRLTLFWALLGSLGTLALFPYALSLNPPLGQLPAPLPVIAITSALQTGILLILLSWIGLRLGNSMGLDTPLARALVYRQPFPTLSQSAIKTALIVGGIGGIFLIGLSLAFKPWMPSMSSPTQLKIDLWKRLLASFYGGITEELLLRLFGMTLISWLLWKLFQRNRYKPSGLIFWLAIVAAAILFGVAHLPVAANIWGLTPIVIFRTILLNALLGIPFGFLYWRWGLEYAMLSHFVADLVFQGIGGS